MLDLALALLLDLIVIFHPFQIYLNGYWCWYDFRQARIICYTSSVLTFFLEKLKMIELKKQISFRNFFNIF